MPSSSPQATEHIIEQARQMGQSIRARRKDLGINATTVAESAGMSRVTLYRIEKGELSVTLGAYFGVLDVLGMTFSVDAETAVSDAEPAHLSSIPVRIRLKDYPVLRQLAWQVHVDELSPVEALDIYERNWRHVVVQSLSEPETRLIHALRSALSGAAGDV